MSKQWILQCRAELSNCTMIIEADTEDEAMEKAQAGDWDDIEYDTSELVDWKITGRKPDLIE